MTAANLVARLREHGYHVKLDGDEIVIRPQLDAAMLPKLRACRDEIFAYLQQAPTESDHRYVLWRGAVDRSRSVCLSCGVPPALHGADVFDDPLVVDNPNDAVVIEACAIVAAAAAEVGQ